MNTRKRGGWKGEGYLREKDKKRRKGVQTERECKERAKEKNTKEKREKREKGKARKRGGGKEGKARTNRTATVRVAGGVSGVIWTSPIGIRWIVCCTSPERSFAKPGSRGETKGRETGAAPKRGAFRSLRWKVREHLYRTVQFRSETDPEIGGKF